MSSCVVVSGGGHSLMNQAVGAGVDCFVTGSFDEYIWHIAYEGHVNFLAFGHSATERVGPQALAKHLQDNLPIVVDFIDIPNPF